MFSKINDNICVPEMLAFNTISSTTNYLCEIHKTHPQNRFYTLAVKISDIQKVLTAFAKPNLSLQYILYTRPETVKASFYTLNKFQILYTQKRIRSVIY